MRKAFPEEADKEKIETAPEDCECAADQGNDGCCEDK